MGLSGKLILIFSGLYALLLGGVLAVSGFFFINSKQRDAAYRMADIGRSIYLAREHLDDAELSSYLNRLKSTHFKTEEYDLALNEVSVTGRGGTRIDIEGSQSSGPIRSLVIATPQGNQLGHLSYSVANLERGMWQLVGIIVGIGAGAFVIGILLILYFSRRSTAHLRELAAAMQQVGDGKMDTRVQVKSRDEVGVLVESFNWMMRGLEEGEFVKNIFKRYVTRQVAEKILAEKEMVHLRGDRREVSILFADIRGFTRLSQKMAPEGIINLLNHYFAPIIDVIIEHEGVLDKFIGDGFLAFWNAPLPQADYALRACRTALEIQKVLGKMNLERENQGEVVVHMGMGIHTGTAIAGNIGSSRRMEYTIIGESVNFAERLQESAAKGEVLVSARTRQLVAEDMKFSSRRIKIEDYGETEIEVFKLVDVITQDKEAS